MKRKEKKELLKNIENSKVELESLSFKITQGYQELSEINDEIRVLSKEVVELEDEVQQYKMCIDIKEEIERLKKVKIKLNEEVNELAALKGYGYSIEEVEKKLVELEAKRSNYYDVDNLVFACYKKTNSKIYNIGIFKIENCEGGMILKHLFAPELCGIIDVKGENIAVSSCDEYSNINIENNLITFFDVLPYFSDVNLITKNKFNIEDIMKVYSVVLENSVEFGLLNEKPVIKVLSLGTNTQ